MGNQESEIRIYVACLASYNNGTLYGAWINATQGIDGIWRDVSQMLFKSPAEYAEEWAIHDYEGFGSIHISEYEGFDTIVTYADFIEEHGDLGAKLISYFGNVDDACETISDHYAGEYDSLSDYAEQLTEETTQIPESLRFYIDYEKMARDLEINDLLTIQTGHSLHVFWRH
ncbi:MAG: antirestriction protein [Robiginitomaculum sp.]|nr:MAG: antirestriction protein [Robiginitomaculum sp.]